MSVALDLRGYQREAVAAAGRFRRLVLCAPTGSGKTVIAARIIIDALDAGQRVVFTAHRRELIRQPFCKLIRYGVQPADVGVIMAGIPSGTLRTPLGDSDSDLWRAFARYRPHAAVQIASIDTLRNHEEPPPFDILIVDEAHRTLAKSYLDLIAKRPEAQVIGLTATPERGDGRGLGEAYEHLHVVASYVALAAQGYLVTPRVWSSGQLPDLSRVKVRGSDFDAEQLAEACDRPELVGDIVAHYERHGGGAPAIAFAAGVEHSKKISEQFNAAGIPAAHVDGGTPARQRDQIFADLAGGALRVVSNCDVASEGTDIPCVKCVISARPTMSLRVWLQQCGRGSRPYGDHQFVVLDHSGNATRHGLPQMDREWALEAKPKRASSRKGLPPAWMCEECFGVNPISEPHCLECGAERPAKTKRELVERSGELVELTPDLFTVAWDVVVGEWRSKNDKRVVPMSEKWIAKRYRERFGKKPPAGMPMPALTPEQKRVRDRFQELQRQAAANDYARGWAHIRIKEELELAGAAAKRARGAPRNVDAGGALAVRHFYDREELIEWAV